MTETPHAVLEHPLELPAPTRARYGVLALLCTMALLLYLDRMCIGKAAPAIRSELGLSETQMAWVFNAFTLAYCLFEVPTGHWGDRFGARGVIARIVAWWSLFTALTGLAGGLWTLLVVRFLFGAGEAGAFPNASRVATRWFPPKDRGKARAAITAASLFGAAVSPILAAVIMEWVGWRAMFGIFGAVGLVWVAIFYFWFRDDPAKHPRVNAAELALISGGPAGAAEAAAPKGAERIPWGTVLASPNVWLLGTIMTVSAILMYVQFQWYPTYLEEARGQTQLSSGWLSGAIMMGGALGCVAGGLMVDAVMRLTPERKWSRRLCGGGSLLLAALSVAGARLAESVPAVTACNVAALFFVQAAIPTWWTVVAETSGRHGAAMWGLMNSSALVGLMVATWAVGRFVESRRLAGFEPIESWGLVFGGVGVGLAVGAVCWLGVDPTRSIVEPGAGSGFPVEAPPRAS